MPPRKRIKKINPIVGGLDTLFQMRDQILGIPSPARQDVFRDELSDTLIIDTACPTDTETWETGISRNGGGQGGWVIVEQYENRDSAEAGHKVWVERLTADPEMELEDIDVWGLKDLDDAETTTD